MKKLLMAAVAVSGLGATPAFAAAQYTVNATVSPVCGAVAGATITFGTGITDSTGAIVTGATTGNTTADGTAYCNGFNSKITIGHTAMALQSPPASIPANYVSTIDFTPKVTTDGNVPSVQGNQTNVQIGAFSALTVNAISPSTVGNAKPLAGSYQGDITITLSPAT